MFAIIWRLVAMVLVAPFAFVFPLIFIAWPIEFYLAVSLAARVWRRNAGAEPVESSASLTR